MSVIQSANSSDEGFTVVIKTDIGEISWIYDKENKCCEAFGVKMSRPLSWLIGRKFENVSLENGNNNSEENNAILTLKMQTDEAVPDTDDKWTIEFYNYHNGYYCHDLTVSIDGKPKWNLSL